MTKPISRKMAVDCLLWQFFTGEHIRIDTICSVGVRMTCGICRQNIREEQDIQFDHIHADTFDGPHEYQNLRPVHAECHKIKTKSDVQALAKMKRLSNPRQSKHPMANKVWKKKMNGETVRRDK
jgi:5-methylcytosine-specific restriction endonuclease McrA